MSQNNVKRVENGQKWPKIAKNDLYRCIANGLTVFFEKSPGLDFFSISTPFIGMFSGFLRGFWSVNTVKSRNIGFEACV